MTRTRWLIVGLVLLAIVFALQAGEYNTFHWLSLRSREKAEQAAVAALRREVDSLTRVKKLVETDPATQERIARELYGMLRAGEWEFTLLRPESER
jgi:cell division protein FtsB